MPLNTPLWTAIQAKAPGVYPVPGLNAYVTSGFGWIIGPYDELCDVAHEIAPGTAAWGLFKSAGAKLGRRGTDLPPFVVGHLPGFRKKIIGVAPTPVPQSVRDQRADPAQRMIGTRGRDQFQAMDAYYLQKGLESHHIVEKSILGKLGVNKGELADVCAPCVLVMAELHRRMYTPGVGSARDAYTSSMTGTAAATQLDTLFGGLYQDPSMAELKAIATVIIAEAKKRKGP
jgi:hypothetical protein